MNNNTLSHIVSNQGILERALLDVSYPIVIFEGIEHRVTHINDAMLHVWRKDRSIIGQSFVEILPEIKDQAFPALLSQVFRTGISHTDTEAAVDLVVNGITQTVYFDNSYTAIRDNQGTIIGVLVISRDVSEQVLAKRMAVDSETKFRNTILQAPVAMAVLQGPDFIIETANEQSLTIWQRTKDVIGKRVAEVFPELKEQGFIGILKCVYETRQPFYGTRLPVQLVKEGILSTFYINFVYHPIIENDEVTSIMALGYDVTELVASTSRAEENELKFRNIVSQAPIAMAILQGPEFIIETANQKSLGMWRKSPEVIGKKLEIVFPEYIDQGFVQTLSKVFQTGEAFYGKEVPFNISQGESYSTIYSNFVYQPIFQNGVVTSILVLGDDVTDLVLARRKAKHREELLEFLNLAGDELALTFDTQTALRKISDLIVPKFADWFTINVLNGDNLDLLIVKNEDQDYVNWAIEYRKRKPITIQDPGVQGHILRTGESVLVPFVSPEFLEQSMDDKEQLEIIKKMNLRSFIVVPMKIGTKILGCINFILTSEGKEYTETDLNFAKDFATRIALALENAKLHEQQKKSFEHTERLLKEMEFQRNRFAATMMQMPGSVVIAEAPSGKMIFANEKVEDVWGHSLKKTGDIDEHIDWVGFHPDKRPYEAHEWPLARSIKNGEIVSNEDVDIIRGDGKPAVLRLSSAPILDNAGKIIAGIVISQDVTVLKEAIRSREEFLSIASHELKTPLTTVTASIQMLQRVYERNPASNSIPGLMDTCYKSSIKLNRLVQELLDVSKIEAGQLVLNKTWFNLSQAVNECCSFITLAGTHKFTLKGDLELEVFADRERIDQVIANFVNNAVKYSPNSREITCLIEKQDNDARLSVIDQGIGIQEEKIPHLFERYYRADHAGFQFSGLGLGLYISAEIIKRHGGKVGVTSQEGLGSTFWFVIPIEA